ncbi:hypothetical protein PN472_19420 [Microcystis aeruginosa CS-1036]|jgi:hypothetical protein|uniref:hypothetical protein n=1 Tax=Microcystis aeruginosa TaxID=1126 RepID=UPI00232DA029|nr:hypothetical protein [Microcystis aeruginosa]MDB9545266.1 hypothetical protein [Microcystis aeruginosa CS-1036]
MDSSSKKTADNDQQDLEMAPDERVLELEKKISDLQKENQELIQKLSIENVTSEGIKKINSHLNEIISIAQKIGTMLLVITGLAGLGGLLGIYSAIEKQAKETVKNYLTDNENQKMEELMTKEIAPLVADDIVKDPEQFEKIIQKIAEILPSQPEFTNNLLGNPRFQATIQTFIKMPPNTSPETKYYVVTGSSFIKKDVETDQEKARRKVNLNSKICISNSQPPAYLMVVAPQNNQDFQLDLPTAKKTLEQANTVPLFKQNGAYFIAIEDNLFFGC